jgi:hypothetical protein
MEPGRPRIEWRDAPYIWVGTRVLNEHGREFTVTSVGGADGLHVVDGDGNQHVLPGSRFRCRVEDQDR